MCSGNGVFHFPRTDWHTLTRGSRGIFGTRPEACSGVAAWGVWGGEPFRRNGFQKFSSKSHQKCNFWLKFQKIQQILEFHISRQNSKFKQLFLNSEQTCIKWWRILTHLAKDNEKRAMPVAPEEFFWGDIQVKNSSSTRRQPSRPSGPSQYSPRNQTLNHRKIFHIRNWDNDTD